MNLLCLFFFGMSKVCLILAVMKMAQHPVTMLLSLLKKDVLHLGWSKGIIAPILFESISLWGQPE